jgi:hypothetical protein
VKTSTTDRPRTRKQEAAPSFIPQSWDDFTKLYPIYEALARQLELPGGPYPLGTKGGSWSDKKVRDRDLVWLDQMDREVQAVHLRHFLVTPAVAREEGLRLFLQRHLCKPQKLLADRDKIDLLLVQYFVLCAPQEMIAGPIAPSDVAQILEPVLGEIDAESLEVHEPLERILDAAQNCSSLRDLMEHGLMEQGKIVKAEIGDQFGDEFLDPAALVAICRFNFLLRRSFIQWLHADLRAIGTALGQLEKRGVKAVDCRAAGFSAQEPISKLQQFHQHWKPPFQTDYSKNSAFKPYEQLMSLRDDLERALGPAVAPAAKPAAPKAKKVVSQEATQEAPAAPAPLRKSKANGKTAPAAQPAAPPAASPAAKTQAPAAPAGAAKANPASAGGSKTTEQALPNIGVADVENLEEKIWEQLIATPPVRGRSMTTVTVENTRILLSAWEVAAFISDSGQDSEELRRLIVARALLSTSLERRKRLMDYKGLHQAVAHARTEIPRFQERVDQLKRTQKTDGAVNLGISLKRLLSLVEEAEQLQKGSETKQEKR